jgi:lipooligosaccharide transport system permease protein
MSTAIQPYRATLWGVYSVWHRHATVFLRTWLVNILPPMTEPILYLVSFGFGLSMVSGLTIGGKPVSYMAYIAPGMIAVAILFQSFFECAYGSLIRMRYQKTWHAFLSGPLGYSDVFTGDLLWAATRGSLAAVVTGLVCLAFGLVSPLYLIAILPLLVLGAVTFASAGLLAAALVKNVDQINIPMFLVIVPMFTLSGTFFPRENLPPWMTLPVQFLPLSPLVDLLRDPFQGGLVVALGKLALLSGWCGLFLFLSHRTLQKHIFK